MPIDILEGRHQRRIASDHRKLGARARRGTVVTGSAGEMVTSRSLEFYEAVGRRLARENRP